MRLTIVILALIIFGLVGRVETAIQQRDAAIAIAQREMHAGCIAKL